MFCVSMYNVGSYTDDNIPYKGCQYPEDSDKTCEILISSEKDIFIFVQESMNFWCNPGYAASGIRQPPLLWFHNTLWIQDSVETGWLSEISLISLEAFRSMAIFHYLVQISFLWCRSKAVLGFLTEREVCWPKERLCKGGFQKGFSGIRPLRGSPPPPP